MKNKIFIIILVALLSLPVCAWAVDENAAIEESTSIANTIDEEAVAQEQVDDTQFKQPISKRKIAKKFLAAMGGVAASSFAIFFILSVYNRVRDGYITNNPNNSEEASLETPDNLNSAIKAFLDKTKWN